MAKDLISLIIDYRRRIPLKRKRENHTRLKGQATKLLLQATPFLFLKKTVELWN